MLRFKLNRKRQRVPGQFWPITAYLPGALTSSRWRCCDILQRWGDRIGSHAGCGFPLTTVTLKQKGRHADCLISTAQLNVLLWISLQFDLTDIHTPHLCLFWVLSLFSSSFNGVLSIKDYFKIVHALELLQSCSKPSIYDILNIYWRFSANNCNKTSLLTVFTFAKTLLKYIYTFNTFIIIIADNMSTPGIWAPSQYKDRLIYVWRFPC